ncbi:uncharacterized protein VICG_00112 [Vittaforma corneae ATCC 50505]|uniref:Exocyst complex component Sec10 n=1 Tax=Vittaforma corneae (strain ATCC 50505) TaxID=993615 RepID=L2GR49_VITCO|nr:uncharacterized protein VICG_00112 [Vittaforma corneae ATCC 50505]ELA42797.1 hypothetical protein VICG_00112 [Vittaforma corneae ATCC 50505]
MKYSLNIDKSEVQVLEALLNSEDTEDWMILAEMIYIHVNYGMGDKTNFLNFSKKLEEKISNIFQESLNGNNLTACKTCFDILTTIEKQYALIDIFLLSKSLLTTDVNVYPQPLTTVDLSLKVLDNTTFEQFLKNVIQILEDNYIIICRVFGLSDEYCEYIFSKISKTLISMSLNSFLNVSSSSIYLICLQSAFVHLQSFGGFVKSLFPKIDFESSFHEIFSQFIYKAIMKETQIFEEVLEIYLSGAKTLNMYTLNGAKVAKTNNYVRIYENMFVLIDSFLNRREMLYSEENEVEVLKFCSKKLCILIDKMVSSSRDCWDTMKDLFHSYLLNKRFLGEKFQMFDTCNMKLTDATQQEFESMVGMIKTFMKGEILNMFFGEKGSHIKLLEYLRRIHEKSKELGERNTKILFYRILDIIYHLLYTQIQHINFDKSRLANVLQCLDDLSGYFSINVSPSLETKFNHLKLMCEMICADQSQFKAMISQHRISFAEKELRDILKCRDGKGNTKDMVFKNSPAQP